MEHHETPDINDLGLQADLNMFTRTPLDRRRVLRLGIMGASMFLTGCGAASAANGTVTPSYMPLVQNPATSTPTATAMATATAMTTPSATSTAACVSEIPQETGGPYPGDGSNGVNVLTASGIVRSDIRTSLSTGTVAPGVPLTVILTLVNTNASCAPLAGYALYLWHCNRAGQYSLYSNGVTNEDYLRGVQAADSNGVLSFTTIFPACYSGRWPHIHFEIYRSLAQATGASNLVHTSQLALPKATCDTVYATDGYSQSVQNLAQISLATDNVFRDGTSLQMATMSGDVASGYTARLTVGVAA